MARRSRPVLAWALTAVGVAAASALTAVWWAHRNEARPPAPPPDAVRVLPSGEAGGGAAIEYRLANRGWDYTVTATNRGAGDVCISPHSWPMEHGFTVSDGRREAPYLRPVPAIIDDRAPPLRLPPGDQLQFNLRLDANYDLRGLRSPVRVDYFAPFYRCEE